MNMSMHSENFRKALELDEDDELAYRCQSLRANAAVALEIYQEVKRNVPEEDVLDVFQIVVEAVFQQD